jgi:hypothetical protein
MTVRRVLAARSAAPAALGRGVDSTSRGGVGMAFCLSAEAVPEREHPSEHVQTGTLAPAVGSTVARRGARSLSGVTQRGQRQVDASEHEDDAPHRPSVPRAVPFPGHARQLPLSTNPTIERPQPHRAAADG